MAGQNKVSAAPIIKRMLKIEMMLVLLVLTKVKIMPAKVAAPPMATKACVAKKRHTARENAPYEIKAPYALP